MKPFLVQFAERTWTLETLHLACAMARDEGTFVVLLHLMRVNHIAWLGTELGDLPPTERQYQLLDECQSVANLYGVALSLQSMQYQSLVNAVAQAADAVDAQAVFVQLSQGKLTILNRLQHWNLTRQLRVKHRQLYTSALPLETTDWTPSVTVKAAE